jgi:multiple sugar transport system ATP-binding protein
MATVRVEHVWKRFDNEVVAVRDVSLEARDGEFLVLVGPSGCGKSTILRMIAGLEEISDGAIYIDDRRVNDVPARNRDIAMVFQNYALYPHMTVADNMAFALKLRGVPKAEVRQRVQNAAEILDIKPYLNRRPKQLSGGQRQRVALGRAIVREPKAFLMDEPLSNLDAKLRVQTRAEIVKLHQRIGTTTIYVTHDQVEAMTMGNRIAVLRDGVLQQIDTPRRLFDHPVNAFVAGFIGSPAMNLIRMHVRTSEAGRSYSSGKTSASRRRRALPARSVRTATARSSSVYDRMRSPTIGRATSTPCRSRRRSRSSNCSEARHMSMLPLAAIPWSAVSHHPSSMRRGTMFGYGPIWMPCIYSTRRRRRASWKAPLRSACEVPDHLWL